MQEMRSSLEEHVTPSPLSIPNKNKNYLFKHVKTGSQIVL